MTFGHVTLYRAFFPTVVSLVRHSPILMNSCYHHLCYSHAIMRGLTGRGSTSVMSSFHSLVQSRLERFLRQNQQYSDYEDQPNVIRSIPFAFHKKNDYKQKFKRCGVLCCLKEHVNGEVSVLVTIRSQKLSFQPGVPCLPGGKEEPTDASIEDTALREAEEEIGLNRDHVSIIGTLPPVVVDLVVYRMEYYVVVCTVRDQQKLVLTPGAEVSGYHWIPLQLFLGGPHHYTEPMTSQYFGKMSVEFFKVLEELHSSINSNSGTNTISVWGVTAQTCVIMASVVFSSPPYFPFTGYYVNSSDTCNIYLKPFRLPDGILKPKL